LVKEIIYEIEYNGHILRIKKLPNGKFKRPDVSIFCRSGFASTWLDEARIPFQSKEDEKAGQSSRPKSASKGFQTYSETENNQFDRSDRSNLKGRFPANLLVSNDVLNDGKILKGTGHFNSKVNMKGRTLYEGGFKNFTQEDRVLTDSGSFSRYFDLDAWFYNKVTDRIKELPKSVQTTFPFLICPKASKSERNMGCENLQPKNNMRVNAPRENEESKFRTKHKNFHPTVKPIKLMSYLVMLGSREGDLVLDPFAGSGTTCIAAKLLRRNYLGIEINKEYCEIAKKRLEAGKNE
jgi:hypothetical protein